MQSYAEEIVESTNPNRSFYMNQRVHRIGQTRQNYQGLMMCIDDYENAHNITVRFLKSGYTTNSTYSVFKSGAIRDPYVPSVFGIGVLGEGYKSKIDGKATKVYNTWKSMMTRCYSVKSKERMPTYEGCYVADEWLNFQNFAKWYDENYYEIEGEKMSLDKDILVKNNKIYSPETSCIVPQFLNSLFVFPDKNRSDLPLGVQPSGKGFKAGASVKEDGRKFKKHLGTYDTKEEAFQAYKEFKEKYHKSVADQYRGEIPEHVYEAICNYKIEITD